MSKVKICKFGFGIIMHARNKMSGSVDQWIINTHEAVSKASDISKFCETTGRHVTLPVRDVSITICLLVQALMFLSCSIGHSDLSQSRAW